MILKHKSSQDTPKTRLPSQKQDFYRATVNKTYDMGNRLNYPMEPNREIRPPKHSLSTYNFACKTGSNTNH